MLVTFFKEKVRNHKPKHSQYSHRYQKRKILRNTIVRTSSRVYILHFLPNGAVNISDYVRSMGGLLMSDKSEGNGRNRSRPNWRYYRKHQYPSQDNNTRPRPNLAPPEHKTRYVTLQEERSLVRTKEKQAKNEGQSKCVGVFVSAKSVPHW
jgi:hypothetical protein